MDISKELSIAMEDINHTTDKKKTIIQSVLSKSNTITKKEKYKSANPNLKREIVYQVFFY